MEDSFLTTLIANLPEATAAEDADIMVLESSTKTQKIKWSTIINLIKDKLGIGSASLSGIGDGTITGAINSLNSNIGQYKSEYFTQSDTAIWLNPGIFVVVMDYSISGGTDPTIEMRNFTAGSSIGHAIQVNNKRGNIVRIISLSESSQIGAHVTGFPTSFAYQISSVRIK